MVRPALGRLALNRLVLSWLTHGRLAGHGRGRAPPAGRAAALTDHQRQDHQERQQHCAQHRVLASGATIALILGLMARVGSRQGVVESAALFHRVDGDGGWRPARSSRHGSGARWRSGSRGGRTGGGGTVRQRTLIHQGRGRGGAGRSAPSCPAVGPRAPLPEPVLTEPELQRCPGGQSGVLGEQPRGRAGFGQRIGGQDHCGGRVR